LPQIGPRACAILNGGVSGGACQIPHEMAEAFWIIVKRRYNQKLKGTKTSRVMFVNGPNLFVATNLFKGKFVSYSIEGVFKKWISPERESSKRER
jgi:hypothetical protein